jgi:hypothetical protein
MFRSLLLSVTPVLLAASAASAALVLNVDHLDVLPSEADQTVTLDVYLADVDGANERMNRFAVSLVGLANTPAGVRFVPPSALPSPAHPYVFRAYPGNGPVDIRAGFSHMLVAQAPQNPDTEVNISETYNGLFSISVLVPAGTPPGSYSIVVDPKFTDFGFLVPSLQWVIGPPGGVTVVPEPAAATCLLALPLLRRRRMGRPL